VLYLLDGSQTSATFADLPSAEAFQSSVKAVGPAKAMDMWGIARTVRTPAAELTVTRWVARHVEHLTGIQPATRAKYKAYLDNDITPHLGDIPLRLLTRDDVKSWVQVLEETGASGKTIKNKANFLSGCLNAAIPDEIGYNPFARVKLPEWKRAEKVYLEREEFDLLLSCVTDYWKPLVEFLVASGLRWAEATALKPAAVNLKEGTVRVYQSWKIVPGGWVLGTTKSKRSVRTVNVPAKVLKKLDLSKEWVFVNREEGPVRIQGFHRRVWEPARVRAKALGLKKRPRIHDLRHTAVSWLMNGGADLASIQAMVGHESIATTIDVYSSLDRRSAKKLSDIMDTQLTD
jgi:integrase